MTTNLELKKALVPLLPQSLTGGFEQLKTPYFCLARQRGPFVDRLSVWVTRHGNFAEATAVVWSPCLTAARGFHGESVDIERMSPVIGGDISVRRVRESWGWDVRPDALESTATKLSDAIAAVALPWFDSIDSGAALVRECALNPDYWRTVSRSDRQAIEAAADEMLKGGASVPHFRLLDARSAMRVVPADGESAGQGDRAGYVQREVLLREGEAWSGTISALRKKE